MKLTFSSFELHAIMQESATFREKILAMAVNDTLEIFRARIRELFPRFMSNQKIPAIKWLRENSRNDISYFEEAGFEAHDSHDYAKNIKTRILSLSASKHFVESC
jgi:hypothetical protein